jgi:hypothetical protein
MNRRQVIYVLFIIFILISLSLLSKDLFQFDLRDYGMAWGMTKNDVLKLKRKEIIENGTKIIFEEENGKKREGYLEYDKKGELFKIWFYIDEPAKPKNYEEYKVVKRLFVAKYRSYEKKMIKIYGNKYNSIESDDNGRAFEYNVSHLFGIDYTADWIYQFYTLVNITFDGNDKYGYELVLQFIGFHHFVNSIKENKK